MATNLSIECADRSVRWYLTPGQASRYEIIVINKSGDEHIDCTMTMDEPTEGGTFEPAAFALRPRERKTVALTFAADTQVPRDQLTIISVRDTAGDVIASLERGLISAGGIDCTVQLAFKEPIMDGAAIRGFLVSCTIKSLSATAGHFALQFTPHPSLEFVDVASVALEPGQTQTVSVPILWNRALRDSLGNNHPFVVEIGVAVSQGKRTGRLPWDVIESKLAAFAPAPAPAEVAASAAPAAAPPAAVVVPPPPWAVQPEPASAPPSPVAASAPPAPQPGYPATPDAGYAPPPPPGYSPQAPAPTYAPPPQPPSYAVPAAPASAQPTAPQYATPTSPPPPESSAAPYTDAAQYASASPPIAPPPAAPPDVRPPEADDALMALLVGKPVSPPPGWRGPGRDAPDAPSQPPSIYARTPPTVTRPQLPAQPQPPAAPPQPPPAPPPVVPPAARPQMPQPNAPPAGSVPQPWMPPPPPQRPAPQSSDAAPQPYRRTFTPANSATEEPPPEDTQGGDQEGIFGESEFESSVVGPPPSLARAVETGKEHRARTRRTVDMPEPATQRSHEGQLASLVIGGTAIIAIALMVFFYLRSTVTVPPAQTQVSATATAASTVPPAVVLETPRPAPSSTHRANASPSPGASAQANAQPSIAPSAAAHTAAQAAQQAISTTAPTPRPAPPKQVALAPKPVHKAPRPHPTRRPIPANPNLIVSTQGIDAHYGQGGHAVRVLWGAAGQASAVVQLSDDKGSVLSSTGVAGARQTAVLYVPRTYRGSVVVQVVSIGAQGERVTQSMSLPAFGR